MVFLQRRMKTMDSFVLDWPMTSQVLCYEGLLQWKDHNWRNVIFVMPRKGLAWWTNQVVMHCFKDVISAIRLGIYLDPWVARNLGRSRSQRQYTELTKGKWMLTTSPQIKT